MPVLAHAFGAASSLATLPQTFANLRRAKLSEKSIQLSCCIGTNLNNDGILLYEMLAVALLLLSSSPVDGIALIPFILSLAGVCLIFALGISGIPEAGLISLVAILEYYKVPTDIVPLLLSVDWLIGRFRAMTNVTADMVTAHILDARASK